MGNEKWQLAVAAVVVELVSEAAVRGGIVGVDVAAVVVGVAVPVVAGVAGGVVVDAEPMPWLLPFLSSSSFSSL